MNLLNDAIIRIIDIIENYKFTKIMNNFMMAIIWFDDIKLQNMCYILCKLKKDISQMSPQTKLLRQQRSNLSWKRNGQKKREESRGSTSTSNS